MKPTLITLLAVLLLAAACGSTDDGDTSAGAAPSDDTAAGSGDQDDDGTGADAPADGEGADGDNTDDGPVADDEPAADGGTNGDDEPAAEGGAGGNEPAAEGGAGSVSAELMAAALAQLVTEDNTFGGGPPPFSRYLVQSSTDPAAGDGSTGSAARALTEAEQAAVGAVLEPFGPVEFIDDPDEWRTPNLTPTVEGAVILGVGEPEIDGDSALVPVSLWCGGLCGTWLTYRINLVDDAWTVSGVEGPIAIS